MLTDVKLAGFFIYCEIYFVHSMIYVLKLLLRIYQYRMNSYIYVIAVNIEGPVKVGISIHPEKRVRQLQTGRDDVLRVFHKEAIPRARAQLTEGIIHRENRHLRTKGEWFAMSVENAILEIKHAMIRYESEVDTLESISQATRVD